MRIRAISLWEPWASLMAVGAKRFETRSWATRHRGPLLICAARRWSRDQADFLAAGFVQRALRGSLCPGGTVRRDHLQCGNAVAIVELVEWWSTDWPIPVAINESRLGDYSRGRFAWETTNLQRIVYPFPVRGRRGLFGVEIRPNLEVLTDV